MYLASGTNFYIIAGMICYAISIATWMLVLAKTDASYAYPFLSVGYVLSAVAGYYFFQEHISLLRIAGIAIICIGVVLIAKS